MSIFDATACEELIGYTFKNKMLLRKCFTHSSYANEHKEESNELLEFFGDAIIEFVVTEHLFKNAYGDEGALTDKRKDMVSKQPLLKAVNKLGLSDYILLGNGQKGTAKKDEKLFSSLYEAIVAGIYIDGGMSEAKAFIKRTVIDEFESESKRKSKNKKPTGKDGKSELQEYVQKNKLGSVSYETLSKSGPDHLPEFRAAALLNGKRLAEGKGSSKRAAETEAAAKALKNLQNRR
ncbi:MAG: ribonuclease III [Clostridia bacterium]|nr:ribonuclease III [Clostridia bacterium]